MESYLPVIWAAIIGCAVAMYVILDGFDLGIGILFPFAESEQERDQMMNSVAPFWDGNETWLVLGGAGMMVAFPLAYSIILPALYLPVIVMLLALVFRGVAFEFRWLGVTSKPHWTFTFAAASTLAAFCQGLILGTLIEGIKVENGAFAGSAFDWATPFAVLCGLGLMTGYGLLGATWLIMKTDGSVATRARVQARCLLLAVLAFMAIVGQERPDFRTISDCRKQHLEPFKEVFVQVVRLAGEAGLVKLGNVATDGTKIQGNASRHKAMSYGYMKKAVERLREEIEALVTAAYQQDEAEDAVLGSRRGDELPAELARREQRLATIEAAMQRLEAQAKAEAEAERQQRAAADAERQRTGAPRRGKVPKPVDETPADKAQTNFTDPELHIMQTNNKGWEYCGNAQVSVDGACQIIIACDVTDASNDKQQAAPVAQATLTTLAQAGIERPTDESGVLQPIPATLDSGYYSEAATQALED